MRVGPVARARASWVGGVGMPLRALVLACALSAGATAPGAAQQPPDTLTAEQRIRLRLRNLDPLIKDTTTQDTMAVDTAGGDTMPQRVVIVDTIPVQPGEGLTGVTRDPVWEELLRLAGFVPTEYMADTAQFVADSSRLNLRRDAEVVREGARLQADTAIIFHQATGLACAYGNPVASGGGVGNPVASDSLCYDTDRQIGVAWAARTQVDQSGTWFVVGRPLVTVGQDVYGHDTIFTDCELEIPHYHFAARELKVVRNSLMVGRDVTLRFADVPVLWLPFFFQSLARGRRSGILTPRVSINDIAPTSNRYARQIDDVGVFWAINDHFGAEAAMGWRSEDYTKLRTLLEYRFTDLFLSGGANLSTYWTEQGRRFTLSTQNSWQPDERTTLRVSGDFSSNSQFIETRTIDPRELTRTIRMGGNVNRRFDWGSVNLTGDRTQYISENKVVMTLPSVDLNISPITLFEALPGEERWFSNITLNAGGRASVDHNAIDEALAQPMLQDDRRIQASANGGIGIGAFSISGNVNLNDRADYLRENFAPDPANPDTVYAPLPSGTERRIDWSSSIGYQQRLIGSTTFTPSVSLSGFILQGDTTGGQSVAAPTRMNFGADLRSDIYGFYGGIGPVERLRHKISPSISYSYSPVPALTDQQRLIFASDTLIQETSRIRIGANQTFEIKLRRSAQDTARADSIAAAADTLPAAADTAGGPRRREAERPLLLLGINTDAVVYDFVAARETGRGVQTLEIGNSLQSDLFRGLQISFAHRLFQEEEVPETPGEDEGETGTATLFGGPMTRARAAQQELPDRRFDPFLSRVSASFSLNSDSWIFRTLGFGNDEQPVPPASQQQAAQDTTTDQTTGAAIDRTGAGLGLFGGGGGGAADRAPEAPASAVGSWNASFQYTLFRAPPGEEFSRDNQMLTANVSLQPTELWSVNWNTGYSFTDSQFTDHVLTFTRRMHDWDANFDFVKAQNGNFSFQFRVSLRANPDIKLDYEQQDLRGLDTTRPIR
jgi:LptD protein